MRPRLIAITGGLATGKSTFLQVLQNLGFTTLSCDDIVKDLYEKEFVKEKLRVLLGEDILSKEAKVDKKKVLEKIIQDPALRKALEELIHPLVWREIEKSIETCEKRGERLLFVEVPLLFEAHWEGLFDEIWVVTCPEETQRERIEEKPAKELWQRLAALQLPLAEKERRAHRLFSSENSVDQWEREIKEILKDYLRD